MRFTLLIFTLLFGAEAYGQQVKELRNRGLDQSYDICVNDAGVEKCNISLEGASGNVILGNYTDGIFDAGSFSVQVGSSSIGNSEIWLQNSTTGQTRTDGSILLQSGTALIIQNQESGTITLATNATSAISIDASQNVGVGSGATSPGAQLDVQDPNLGGFIARFGDSGAADRVSIAAGGGLRFNGGTDDLAQYDVGTWTPVVHGTSATPVMTITTNSANYIKIGKMVFLEAQIVIDNINGATGQIRVDIPFTKAATQNPRGVLYTTGYDYGANTIHGLWGFPAAAAVAELIMIEIQDNGALLLADVSNLSAGDILGINITFIEQ